MDTERARSNMDPLDQPPWANGVVVISREEADLLFAAGVTVYCEPRFVKGGWHPWSNVQGSFYEYHPQLFVGDFWFLLKDKEDEHDGA